MKITTKTEFKQTEVGMIPEHWEVGTLEDIASEITDGSHFSPKESLHGDRIIATVRDMRRNGFSFENCKRIFREDFDRLVKDGCSPKVGDILISKDGAKCLDIIFVYEREDEIVVLSSIAIVRPKPGFDSHFYRYYLLSPSAQRIMREGYVTGSAIPRVVLKDLRRVPVPTPPIKTQRGVARILCALDAKIELNQQMNTTLQKIAKAVFTRWFVDFEFPDEEGKPYKSSGGEMVYNEELRQEIPRGWGAGRLGDHSIIKGRIGWKGLQVSEYVDDGPLIVGGKQLMDNRVNWDACPRVPQSRYDESPEIMLRKGDILMTKDGTIGKLAYANELIEPATVASGIFVIRSDSPILSQMYLWSYFASNRFGLLVESRIEGSVVPHLYQRDITELMIALPAPEVILQFEAVSGPIQHRVDHNSDSSKTLRGILDLLLPKLMSGKIRVPVEVI